MTTRAEAAATLRQIADQLEQDDTAELEGEITLIRTVMPAREEVERWAKASEVYREPEPRLQTFTLSFGNGAFSPTESGTDR